MSRWFVTGAVGFIGYHLGSTLLARGDEVVAFDDFSSAPYPLAAKRHNERDLRRQGGARFSLFEGCITDAAALDRAFDAPRDVSGQGPGSVASAANFDGVIHLAGLAGVRPSFDDPARYLRVNVEGTATILEAARRHRVPQIVFASSSSVYGNSTPLPASEDAAAILPESPYAASKRGAELVAVALSRRLPELPLTALRFFTVYGPRQRPEMAISSWTRALLEGRALRLFGDGSMRRDFTHVDDIVRGVLAALERRRPGYRVFNLGSGAPVDLRTVVSALGQAVGSEARVERDPVPLGDVEATYADIRRARHELGWAPQVSLSDGLRSVVDWVRSAG